MTDSTGTDAEFRPGDEHDSVGRPKTVRDIAAKLRLSELPWKRIGLAAGGVAVAVGGTVVATLAATHKSAVFENAMAYAHGLSDAMVAMEDGRNPFDSFDL
ncbi:MAG TPA: hypothetical protein VF391_04430 [Dermatophilaceae bacterium]|jgi:hypothetical protein